MSRDSWYRSTTWDTAIEAAFEAKLARARSKEQYLRIQALYLVKDYPEVALKLLDRYFALGQNFGDAAVAHEARAEACLVLGRLDDAIASYEATLKRESECPGTKTGVWVAYPYLIATRGLRQHFARALQVLDANRDYVAFPLNRFRASAARALILAQIGSENEARTAARLALAAAAEETSEFRYHKKLGLVSDAHANVIHQLRKYCDA